MLARVISACFAILAFGTANAADPVLMSGDWARAACAAWNADPALTKDLADSGWINNDADRGFKALQVFREDCDDQPTAEIRISLRDGKAHCVYGGPVETTPVDKGADYVMHATTEDWLEMGAGEYGPMKAMMFGRLSFKGPYSEAMGNMGPFSSFLLLVGKVPSSADSCPH